MIGKSLLNEIAEEESRYRLELESEMEKGLEKLARWRERKLNSLTKENWLTENEFWKQKLVRRKWELEGPSNDGTLLKDRQKIQQNIDNYLDWLNSKNLLRQQDLKELPIEEIKRATKDLIMFTSTTLGEENNIYAHYLTE